jgi:hypothetical protein
MSQNQGALPLANILLVRRKFTTPFLSRFEATDLRAIEPAAKSKTVLHLEHVRSALNFRVVTTNNHISATNISWNAFLWARRT